MAIQSMWRRIGENHLGVKSAISHIYKALSSKSPQNNGPLIVFSNSLLPHHVDNMTSDITTKPPFTRLQLFQSNSHRVINSQRNVSMTNQNVNATQFTKALVESGKIQPMNKNLLKRIILHILRIDLGLNTGFFSTSPKKLKHEKNQNSSTKLKVLANLVKINAENKANTSKNEAQLD